MSMCGPTFLRGRMDFAFWYKITLINQLHNDKLYGEVGE